MQLLKILSPLIFPFFINTLIAQDRVIVTHKPERPLKELMDHRAMVNFDMVIENRHSDTITLEKIVVAFVNKQNKLLQEKYIDNNGTAPSILMIPGRQWNGATTITVFNPFPELKYAETDQLHYSFSFKNTRDSEFVVKHSVILYPYKQPVPLILPLQKTLMVYDGHDFYSHHRRFDTEFKPVKGLGFTSNMMRYAYDLLVVDSNGNKFTNDGKNNKDWFGWGAEVRAVAAGTIAAVVSSQLDNKEFNIGDLQQNPLALFGNYVVIQHEEGVYSLYGHLQQHSSSHLTIGKRIQQGQRIGAIGVSGSSFIPHLHFQMQNGLQHGSEGIPSYFNYFSFIMGTKKQKVMNSTINTGDIIRAN
jgi:murein DD-endopeptidase MepM/ murein hydrolase activator NlpD